MPVEYQKLIYRSDLRARPNVLFVFGDNFARIGLGGQAKEMRGEPNAIGIPTKKHPSDDWQDFIYDDDLELFKVSIADQLIELGYHLKEGGTVVFPADGIGTGLARLAETSPKCWEWLNTALASMCINNPEGSEQ